MPSNPPTSKQLAYLRALAERTGQTFATPRTSQEANAALGVVIATGSARTHRGCLAGAVVALQPGVEVLGEGLVRDPELPALGADLHPRTELRGRALAAEAALLTLAPVAVGVQGPIERAAPGHGVRVHAGIFASSDVVLLALAAETACRLLPKSCHTG